MNLSFSKEDQEFQQEVRTFIEQNYPSEIKEKQDQGIPLSKEDTVKWHKILNDKGWLAVIGLRNLAVLDGQLLKNIYFKMN